MSETGQLPAGTTVYHCPLPTCEWTHAQMPPSGKAPEVPERTAVGMTFGEIMHHGTMAILAEWYARSERAIEDHLKTHSLLEWVQEVQRLRRVADAAEVWADFQTAAAMDAQELERREREAEEALRDAVAESRPGDRR